MHQRNKNIMDVIHTSSAYKELIEKEKYYEKGLKNWYMLGKKEEAVLVK